MPDWASSCTASSTAACSRVVPLTESTRSPACRAPLLRWRRTHQVTSKAGRLDPKVLSTVPRPRTGCAPLSHLSATPASLTEAIQIGSPGSEEPVGGACVVTPTATIMGLSPLPDRVIPSGTSTGLTISTSSGPVAADSSSAHRGRGEGREEGKGRGGRRGRGRGEPQTGTGWHGCAQDTANHGVIAAPSHSHSTSYIPTPIP